MEKEHLKIIISELESTNDPEDAYFGIFVNSRNDESFISANKQGLELYAAELLKASLHAEEILEQNPKSVFPLSHNGGWIDDESDILIQYVEPSLEDRVSTKPGPYIETSKDLAIKTGCIFGLLVAVISSVIGFITLLGWLM